MSRRLIDADELLDMLSRCDFAGGSKTAVRIGNAFLHRYMPQIIALIPTIDAVEVIRCKNCEKKPTCKHTRALGINGYCSEGERK